MESSEDFEGGGGSKHEILEYPKIAELVALHEIKEEDFPLLQELLEMDNNLIITRMHNYFSVNRGVEGTRADLENSIARIDENADPSVKRLYEIALRLFERYEFAVIGIMRNFEYSKTRIREAKS